MKNYLLRLKAIAIAAMVIGVLASCATSGEGQLRLNLGDLVIERLHIGMTSAEVDVAIGDLKQYVREDLEQHVRSELYLFNFYSDNYFPKDVLKTVQIGSTYRVLTYYTNRSKRNAGTLAMFFDDETKRLRGWANSSSEQSRDKFMHERLTSQLKTSEGGSEKGMSHAQVHALIGEPDEIISPPSESRAIYENHFWLYGASFAKNDKIEVYTYSLGYGTKRRVYLLYYSAADRLRGWGYDHSWEEAERYLLEKTSKTQ